MINAVGWYDVVPIVASCLVRFVIFVAMPSCLRGYAFVPIVAECRPATYSVIASTSAGIVDTAG